MEKRYLTRNQLFRAIRDESKNHGEYPFHPERRHLHDGRVADAESSLRLYFNDEDLTPYSDDEKITWRVIAIDLSHPLTMQTALFLNGTRVAGIDPQLAPCSFRYDRSTVSKAKYHMNIINCNEKGAVISNTHLDISEFKEYFTDIYRFAEAVAKIWNIDYWTDQLLL